MKTPTLAGCSGFHRMKLQRREAIRIGFCSALGLSMADLLKHEACAAVEPGFFKEWKAKSSIRPHDGRCCAAI